MYIDDIVAEMRNLSEAGARICCRRPSFQRQTRRKDAIAAHSLALRRLHDPGDEFLKILARRPRQIALGAVGISSAGQAESDGYVDVASFRPVYEMKPAEILIHSQPIEAGTAAMGAITGCCQAEMLLGPCATKEL